MVKKSPSARLTQGDRGKVGKNGGLAGVVHWGSRQGKGKKFKKLGVVDGPEKREMEGKKKKSGCRALG